VVSDYDVNNQISHSLMKGRLGVYDKRPFDKNTCSIDGVKEQAMRLRQAGGNR
jgi:hypothetical protein